jgi:hypothetical protein
MSEDFLTRWSRRKRDGGETEQAKSAPGERDTIAENATPLVQESDRAAPPEPVFDLKNLPPIESITAATDIRPFLAPGVPGEIARAALRRAWSADPRIREFVGLADYDWDYHTPGSAAGFGPLEMTDELRQMVARIVGDIVDTDASKSAGEPATGTERLEEPPPPASEAKHASALADGIKEPLRGPASRTEPVVAEATASAALQHASPQSQTRQPPIRRGHGRALPK